MLYRLEVLDADLCLLESHTPNAFEIDRAVVVSVPIHWDKAALHATLDGLREQFPDRQVIVINDAVKFLRLVEVPG